MLLVRPSFAQNSSQVALDTNETLFAVLAAINTCGYDAELDSANVLRSQVRDEIKHATESSPETQEIVQNMCKIYTDHVQADSSRALSQYVSLALYLTPPPALAPKIKEAELPPDTIALLAFPPALQKFYTQVNLHGIWERHQYGYQTLLARYHEPVAKMLFDTEIYLRLPSAGYLGRAFTVYIEPMGAPAQTNARNYGSDYFVVLSPGKNADLKMEQIRHTYLHYLLDPMMLKSSQAVKQLEPLLVAVRTAPMDQSFKTDASLLTTECLIRAIEARTTGSSKTPEEERLKAVEAAEKQGFILTGYFYQALLKFEKSPEGLRTVYNDLLANIDVRKEEKQAAQLQFAAKADPDVLRLSQPAENKLLITAMQHLSTGDADGAQKLAQQALDEKREDPGRALFILAQVATSRRDMENARKYFQQALDVASEPKVVAWSHIYLGRILDLQEDREAALGHYRAALGSSAAGPEAKAAAERGIEKPYEPARPPTNQPPAQ